MRLTMYGRAECCLCDDMWQVAEQVAGERGLEVTKIDVDDDPELAAAYGERVPLLFIDGQPAFKFRVTVDALRARLGRRAG